MIITCGKCGNSNFAPGVIEPALEGGYDVIMPCATCGHPNPILHDEDPEFANMLLQFFGDGPSA